MPRRALTLAPDRLVGCYGKLPSAGDFLRRGLDQSVRSAVDQWLQKGLQRGGLAWSFNAPPWRFAAKAGVFGQTALAGLLAPSQDRVGRLFPMFLAAEPRAAAGPMDAWFGAAEALLADAFEGVCDADDLADGLSALDGPDIADCLADAGLGEGRCGSAWWSGEDFSRRVIFENELDAAALHLLMASWRSLEPQLLSSQSPSSDGKGPDS